MPRLGRALALVFCLVFCLACESKGNADDQARLLHALDALRDAPAEALRERRRLLDALEATPASGPRAALARDTCAAAYRLLLDGTELERAVAADLGSDAGPTSATIPRLLDAERKINQSRTLMPDCERAIADLRLRPPR